MAHDLAAQLPLGLLNRAQAAEYLGVSERHIQRLWEERRLAAVKVGRFVRWRREDLDAFIESSRIEALR